MESCLSYLFETDVGRLLAEALPAEVKTVFADQTPLMGAQAAVRWKIAKEVPVKGKTEM